MSSSRPPFIDASFAADLLGLQTADVLDLVASGKLASLGGKDRNPFVRTAQVEALAKEMGRDLSEPAAKKRATQNPVKRIELRLRHDARWSEVAEEDIAAWTRGLDDSSRQAARKVAEAAVNRLQLVLAATEQSTERD